MFCVQGTKVPGMRKGEGEKMQLSIFFPPLFFFPSSDFLPSFPPIKELRNSIRDVYHGSRNGEGSRGNVFFSSSSSLLLKGGANLLLGFCAGDKRGGAKIERSLLPGNE